MKAISPQPVDDKLRARRAGAIPPVAEGGIRYASPALHELLMRSTSVGKPMSVQLASGVFMSMPAPIRVAIVAATVDGLAIARNLPALFKKDIAPRYSLVTLDCAASDEAECFAKLNPQTFGFWIALDSESKQACESLPEYTRGFYDHGLPDRVVIAKNREDLQWILLSLA